MANRKSASEWERIEREYCSTDDSVSEIADRYDISRAAIQKRAKSAKWERPVAPRKRVQLERQPPPPLATDPEQPLDAASIADGGRSLVSRMLDELDVVTTRRGQLEEMIEAATDGDKDDDRRIAMMRAVDLPTRANTMKTLALALKTLNEASAPQGKKAAQQERANAVGGASRFTALGPPRPRALN